MNKKAFILDYLKNYHINSTEAKGNNINVVEGKIRVNWEIKKNGYADAEHKNESFLE